MVNSVVYASLRKNEQILRICDIIKIKYYKSYYQKKKI